MAEETIQATQISNNYPTSEAKTTGQSGGSGGGGMSGAGYAQAGAATFDTAVNWLMFGQEREQIEKWRREDLALAKDAQAEARRQVARENVWTQQQMELAEDQFDFGKQRWGEEFGLTKRQAMQNLKMTKASEKRSQQAFDTEQNRTALTTLKNNLNSVLGNDIQMKQLVASRMGAL